jgi:hypothetical protein
VEDSNVRRRLAATVLCALLVVLGLVSSAAATKPNPDHKITLCHRTASYTNPYVVITVDIASVIFEGHDGHDGRVFFPTIPKHEKWGDIIPPFNFGPGRVYAGKNWTAEGSAIFDAGCIAPGAPQTTTTPTVPPTVPPTTTPGDTGPTTTTPTSSPGPVTTTSTVPQNGTSTTTLAGDTTTTSTTFVFGVAQTPPTSRVAGVTAGGSSPLAGALPRTGGAIAGLALLAFAALATGLGLARRRRMTIGN